MSQENGLSNGEFEISVAAAAFAILSLEGDGDEKKGEKEEKRIRTTNSGKNSGSFSRWFSNGEAKDDDKLAGDKATTKSRTTTQHDSTVDHKKPEIITNTTPSIRRTATFSDQSTGFIKSSPRDGSGNGTTQGAKSHAVKKKTRFSSFKMTTSNKFGSFKDK